MKVLVNNTKEYDFSYVPDEVAARIFIQQILFEGEIKNIKIECQDEELFLDGEESFTISTNLKPSNFKILVDGVSVRSPNPMLAAATAVNAIIMGADKVSMVEVVGRVNQARKSYLPQVWLTYNKKEF